jgi:hypothetical protein
MTGVNDKRERLAEVTARHARAPFEALGLGGRTNFQSRAPRSGADFKTMALARLEEAGGTIEQRHFSIGCFPVDALVAGSNRRRFLVLARGAPDEQDRGAFRRTDTVEKTGFMAMQLARRQALPIILVTSDLPRRSSKAGQYLAALSDDVWDVLAYRGDFRGFQRLRAHFDGPLDAERPAAPWRAAPHVVEPRMFEPEAAPLES